MSKRPMSVKRFVAGLLLALSVTAVSECRAQFTLFISVADTNGSITAPVAWSSTASTNVAIGGISTPIDAQPAAGYIFDHWTLLAGPAVINTAVQSQTLLMTGAPGSAVMVSASFRRAIPLTVTTGGGGVYGTWGFPGGSPVAGNTSYTNGQTVTAYVLSPAPDIGGGNLAVCTGFVGSGSVPASGVGTNVQFQITTNSTLTWGWVVKPQTVALTITSQDGNGNTVGDPQPLSGVTNLSYNLAANNYGFIRSLVSSPYLVTADERALVSGYTGTGSMLSGTGAVTSTRSITVDSSVTWNWNTQYRLGIKIDGNGAVSRNPGGVFDSTAGDGTRYYWYPVGQPVTLSANQTFLDRFLIWHGGEIDGSRLPTANVVVSGPKVITATFGLIDPDSNNDGIPDWWCERFGLNATNDVAGGDGVSGATDDPDNDGLPNLLEYRISYQFLTNMAAYAESSPINADSDGDGIDDGYEFRNVLPITGGSVPGSQTNAQAVVDSHGTYGWSGNPDGDAQWNTATGYVNSNAPLYTLLEWRGPDDINPCTYLTITPAEWVPVLGHTACSKNVRRLCTATSPLFQVDNGDTGDQSSSDSTDSEIAGPTQQGDGFDDGFEYSWDRWQGLHAGDPISDPLGRKVPRRWGTGPGSKAALVADVSGDGVNDLIVANYNFNDVSVFFNAGGALTLQTKRYPVGAGPVAMASGRFQLTNVTDFVTVNKLDNSISVLLHDASNTLNVATYPVGAAPVYAAVGYFNGDANLDIAVANSAGNSITILTNDTMGVFATYATIPMPGVVPVCVAAGPVYSVATNTAYMDLLVADGGGTSVRVIRNTAGAFTVQPAISVNEQPSSLLLGDFNKDGTNDFVVTTLGNDLTAVKLYQGRAPGSFVFLQGLFAGEAGYPVHVASGYFDSQLSPDLDVAVASFSNKTGRVYLGNKDGILTAAGSVDLDAPPTWVAVGDLNLDGIQDLVYVCTNDTVEVFRGYGDGSMGLYGSFVPADMGVDRRFNPGALHVVEPDSGRPDYDIIYKSTGGVGNWFTDSLEYHAWDIGIESNLIMRSEFPALPRCTNPFLWDTDGDTMPDAWEIVFKYDPWDRTTFGVTADSAGNSDGDFYAVKGALIHNAVYQSLHSDTDATLMYHDFNPTTAIRLARPTEPGNNTATFNNRLELLGGRTLPAFTANDPNDRSTNPLKRDTDKDGMWDGWELYVGLNPINGGDGGADSDPNTPNPGDGLSNLQEFLCPDTLVAGDGWTMANGELTVTGDLTAGEIAEIQARITFVQGWQNKTQVSDPFDHDTDDDQVDDGAERAAFNYAGTVGVPITLVDENSELVTVNWVGSGLSPTSADTDGDFLPDFWEMNYKGDINNTNGVAIGNGMDGSVPDALGDYDNDGLKNFQEYLTGCIPHWQYRNNNNEMLWTPGLGVYGYEPYNFFDETLSTTPAHPNGDAMTSYGGRAPKYWDAHALTPLPFATPWRYITAAEPPNLPKLFSTTDPRSSDSDWDSMDDYWEVYHMLNPVRGVRDLVTCKIDGMADIIDAEAWDLDTEAHPWVAGGWEADPDQDGLPNVYESIQANSPAPNYYHTDPSPYWMSDVSYEQSWCNLYYWTGFNFGINGEYFWFQGDVDAFPQYFFDFEMNEGFDTDNDGIGDRAELVSNSTKPGKTDPLSSGDPIKRRALFLNGNAAARTFMGTSIAWQQFRSFTIEAWVRPSNPISGTEQVIIERPGFVANGNPLNYPTGIRLNFRLGIDPNGCPFVGYNGGGYDPIFQEAKAGIAMALPANQWAHLAGVYDGAQSRLLLYVNGVMAAMLPTGEIPFNGSFGPPPANSTVAQGTISMPIVIGARDSNPPGSVNGSTILVTGMNGMTSENPQLDHYFAGWVDEIRIWSGARSQSEIQGNRLKRFTSKDVTQVNTGKAVENLLIYSYGFDDLPDPDHSGVAPVGFELLTGYPKTGTPYAGAPWWATAPDRNLSYNEYRYVPWIENLCSHSALTNPADSPVTSWGTNTSVANGITNTTVNLFPNSSNPYTFQYRTKKEVDGTEAHPFLTSSDGLYGDLLPLRWAQADEDVPMWDNGTVPAVAPFDTDGDGMSDDWETAHGLDPRSAVGENGASGDPDGDGLNNYQEYLCGTDPWNTDTGSDGISDAMKDSDGDGLSNLMEFQHGTMPNMKDTDDDGLTDWEEVTGHTDPVWDAVRPAGSCRPLGISNPLNSLSPAIQRSVYLDGNARLIVPTNDKLMSTNWTVETWVKPDTNSVGGVLVERFMAGVQPGQYGINYELGLTTNNALPGTLRLYTCFGTAFTNVLAETRLDGTGVTDFTNGLVGVLIPLDVWTHVAGVFDSGTNMMSLYVNGKLAAYRNDIGNFPPTVFGYAKSHWGDEVTLGASRSTGAVTNGYKGYMDNVRIWQSARSAFDISERYNAPAGEFTMAVDTNTVALKAGIMSLGSGLTKASLLAPNSPTRMIVKFASEAAAKDNAGLSAAGVEVLNYVGTGVRAVKATPQALEALGAKVVASGVLSAANKISPLLNVGTHGARQVVVSFFKDTAQSDAIQAVQSVGGTVYNNRYIAAADVVATLTDVQLKSLAVNNAVAWIFPAAAFLTSGAPVRKFSDHVVGGAEVAAFVNLGEGWDGPGKGSASLTYHFTNYQSNLDPTVAKASVLKGILRWTEVASIYLTETATPGKSFSMDIWWEAIDGPSGILGQGYPPNDINPEPIAGDFRLDSEETWVKGHEEGGIDMEYVSCHEGGHCLGMGHSDDPTAVMYAFYDGSRDATLSPDDIQGIQNIYGTPAKSVKLSEFRFDDGGETAEDFSETTNWLSGWSAAARLDGAVFTTNTVALMEKDTDGDGMPDWWEIAKGLDPYSSFGDNGAYGDPDSDGINNFNEYRCGTDPHSMYSFGSISDGDLDSDGDGIRNWEEANLYNTNPADPDSDDDGLTDLEELDNVQDPSSSISPYVMRTITNDGLGWIEVPATAVGGDPQGLRLNLTNAWTIEAMVRLADAPSTNVLVLQRRTQSGRVSYELGIAAGTLLPYVRFETAIGREYRVDGDRPVTIGKWTHLGGRYGADIRDGHMQLALFMDYTRCNSWAMDAIPASGIQTEPLIIAKYLRGEIDELRIWKVAREDVKISDMRGKTLLFGADAARAGSLVDDMVAPVVPWLNLTEWTVEGWFKTTEPGTILRRYTGTLAADGTQLLNYELYVDTDFLLKARYFARYDREVIHNDHSDPCDHGYVEVRLSSALPVTDGKWHHACMTMTADRSSLYLDGAVEGEKAVPPSREHVNVWHADNPGIDTVLDASPSVQGVFSISTGAGAFSACERGMQRVDELRVYNRALTSVEIEKSWTQKETPTFPGLLAYYDFDDLVIDPNAPTVPNIAPSGTVAGVVSPKSVDNSVNANAPVEISPLKVLASKIAAYFPFDDGRYLARGGADPRAHAVEDFLHEGWQGRDFAGALRGGVEFSPLSNPYTNGAYAGGRHISPFPLPLDSPWRVDSDGDGIPDIFEQYYELDANRSTIPTEPSRQSDGDFDGDGLSNLYEYLAGTDPTVWDSDQDGVSDADEDPDGDGLTNLDEQRLGSHPSRKDTDDDGIDDDEEANLQHPGASWLQMGHPSFSDSPRDVINLANPDTRYRFKSMKLDGRSYVIPSPASDAYRFNQRSWTLEAWVRPTAGNLTGSLIKYAGTAYTNGVAQGITFYELGLTNGSPYVKMDVTGNRTYQAYDVVLGQLDSNKWTHVAGTFDPDRKALSLYRDGVEVAQQVVLQEGLAASDTANKYPGQATIGDAALNNCGSIDEVRVWRVARTQDEIADGVAHIVQAGDKRLVCDFRFDDGRRTVGGVEVADGYGLDDGQGAEDYAHPIRPPVSFESSLVKWPGSLETPNLYSLRGITFDVDNAFIGTRFESDDADADGLSDAWETLFFNKTFTYPVVNYDDTVIEASEKILGATERSWSLGQLGWEIAYSPITTAPTYNRAVDNSKNGRWFEAPDAAWMIKDVYLTTSQVASAELRFAFHTQTPSSLVYVNGSNLNWQALMASDALVDCPEDTFENWGKGAVNTVYIPSTYLTNMFHAGWNRIAVQQVNEDGNTATTTWEYFNLQMTVDSSNVVIQSGARWWVNYHLGSMTLPMKDGQGLNWYDELYAVDGPQDPDGDGLPNSYEAIVGSNPLAKDTDGDGVVDGQEDPDADGLQNSKEFELGSDPRMPDTDDDGTRDDVDPKPADSLVPLKDRVLELDGSPNSYVEAPALRRWATDDGSFTIAVWACPKSLPASGQEAVLVERRVADGIYNYSLRVDSLGAVKGIMTCNSSAPAQVVVTNVAAAKLSVGKWIHVALVYDAVAGGLQLFVDGVQSARVPMSERNLPAWNGMGPVSSRIGESFNGYVDEVALYGSAVTPGGVQAIMGGVALVSNVTMKAYYRFDDGTSWVAGSNGTSSCNGFDQGQVQDFGYMFWSADTQVAAGFDSRDWARGWKNAGTLKGGARISESGKSGTPPAPIVYAVMDSDSDGMPDWWEVANGLNPLSLAATNYVAEAGFETNVVNDPILGDVTNIVATTVSNSVISVSDAGDDPDGDGLSNYDEYRSGTDPWRYSTDGSGISDYDRDSDSDGLSNGDELNVFGCDPLLVDTDDDGYPDGVEASNVLPDPADNFGIYRLLTGPADSLSPSVPRSFVLSGKGITAPNGNDPARFSLVTTSAVVNPPVVTITEPVDNADIAVRFTTVKGSVASAVPLQAVRLYNNGLFVKDLGSASNFSETIIIMSGTNTIEARATDLDGVEGSDKVRVNGTFARADIRVTQTWDQPGDLDTWLIDPLRRHMGWTTMGPGYPTNIVAVIPHSMLDIDDIPGTGPENITVDEPFSTNGNYEVWMNNFANRSNPNSTVRVLVLEGRSGQQYVEFGPQPMPVSDDNGNNPQAWWHVTTIHMPDGTMTPPGTPVGGNSATNTETGISSLEGWTIEGWVKPGNASQTGAIGRYMQKDGRLGYVVGLSNNCPFVKMGLASGSSYRVAVGALPANEWTHVAYVYCKTDNSLRIYVNGNFTAAQQVLESRAVGAGDLAVDSYANVPGEVFTSCKLDELRFWSKARNGGTIRALMNKVVAKSASLVACYRFDDGGVGIEDMTQPTSRSYDLGGVPSDVLIDAKPGQDGVWGTGDDIAAGAGSDGQNDYVTCSDAAPVDALIDSDKDGLPDWWEAMFGGTAGMDPAEDTDGDGLNNLNEYYANTNPRDSDSNSDGILDGDEDTDGDGLLNFAEQAVGSDPLLPDTDDDGINDDVEVASGTSPTSSLSPLRDRVLSLDGAPGSYVAMPDVSRLALTDWTLEAWVRPNALGTAMNIVSRRVQSAAYAYSLGLEADGRVTAMYTPGDLSANVSISSVARVDAGAWTHVAASYSAVSNALTVYVNGCENGRVVNAKRPKLSGIGPVLGRIGEGFNGQIEEVAVYSSVLSEVAMKADMKGLATHELGGNLPAPACYYRFDDGTATGGTSGRQVWTTGQVQDFAPSISADWRNRWRNAGTLVGGAAIVTASADAPVLYTVRDADGDGLPDWWEIEHGLDPNSADGNSGAAGDPDGDGLSNLGEYLSGTDPFDMDTDNDGLRDGDEDADGDMLSNREEMERGTLPNVKDTDDDGVSDYEEVTGTTDPVYGATRPATSRAPSGITDPRNAVSPPIARSMKLDGSSRVIVPPSGKMMSEDWTVELWACPATNSDGGVLVSRYVGGLASGQSGINYELGLTTNSPAGTLRPYVRYALTTSSVENDVRLDGRGSTDRTNGLAGITISTNLWTHLAGTYSSASNTLSLYVNGKLAAYRTDAVLMPPTVFGTGTNHWRDEVTIGAARSVGAVTSGYEGLLDEVRIWKDTLPAANIAERYNAPDGIPNAVTTEAIRLKNGKIIPKSGLSTTLTALADGETVRAVVTFSDETVAANKGGIEAAGGKVVGYVAKKARVVKTTKAQLAALGSQVASAVTLSPSDKISLKLGLTGAGAARYMLVNFFSDVTSTEAVQAVQLVGGSVHGSGYIGGTYLVARLDDQQAVALAAVDGAAWLCPAASYLTDGSSYHYLSDTLVQGLAVAPFVAESVGWDGPGRGPADLKYYFKNVTTNLPENVARKAVTDQFAKWAAVAALTFTETMQAAQEKSLDIAWYAGDHGDGGAFDGPSGILAHGFFPDDVNPEPIAGDLHFDAAETWTVGAGGIDLPSVALHEMGHCLGLGHSDDQSAIMYPFYSGGTNPELAPDDIAGIQSIYGVSATGPTGPVYPPRSDLTEFRFDDGGLTAEDFAVSNDWTTVWAHAAVLSGAQFWTNSTPNLDKDTDADGLPDWWEMAHGLDPYSTVGVNGGFGDPDGDGLGNRYEFLAGTDPRDADTDNDGFEDYDSRTGPGYRTFGEIWDDGDGIPDAWEILYSGPCVTTGKRGLDPAYYDANLDPDEDGWDNYSEYMTGSDPLDHVAYPKPQIQLHTRYSGRLGNTLVDALGGGSNLSVRLSFYHVSSMDGFPDATLTVKAEETMTRSFATGHIVQGMNYVFAYLDVNGDSSWSPDTEPAGIAQFQPLNLGWGDINNVEIGLTDEMPGYPRFTWAADSAALKYIVTYGYGTNTVRWTIRPPRNYFHEGDYRNLQMFGIAPDVAPTFLVYKDIEPDGYLTFSTTKAVPSVYLVPSSLATPNGSLQFEYARNEIEFRVDTNAAGYRMQIAATSNGTAILSTTNIVPYMDINGVRKVTLPFYAGDNYVPPATNYASAKWSNGLYWSRVQGFTASTNSAYSPWSSFLVNLRSPASGGKSEIDGSVYYFGKVSHGYGAGQSNNLTMIVQAFQSAGFSGSADGQVQITYNCNTNIPSANKGAFSLMGLRNSTYYVRAFIDLNGNRTLDSFEPMGFARFPASAVDYAPLPVDLKGQAGVLKSAVNIVIRDRDTDDDGLPDGWEWMYYGNTANMSSNLAANGMTLLRNYEIEPMDLDPTRTDYDGDGVLDVAEITYDGNPDVGNYDPYDPLTNPNGKDLNPAKWDTDGDGLSDGYEIAHGLNPIDPRDGAGELARARAAGQTIPGAPGVTGMAAVSPAEGQFTLTWQGQVGMAYEVQYSDNLTTWQTAAGGSRYGAAVHTYTDQSPKVSTRFYRVIVK